MISKIKLYVRNTSPWLLFTLGCYVVAFLYLFAENFVFSKSVDLLAIREIDDFAFQSYIRDAHKNFKIFRLNGYAYGWIFWFPLLILMYPLYMLSVHFGIDMPLVVLPRQISLIFIMATAVFLYKIAAKYTKDQFLRSIAILLFLSYPTTGAFALQFGSTAQNMFFSALAFYLAINLRKDNTRDLILVAVTFAAAVATKVSALLIGPAVFLILADRYEWKINKSNIIAMLQFICIFLLCFVVLSQTKIAPIINQIKTTQAVRAAHISAYNIFLNGIASLTLYPGVFILLMCGILARPFLKLKHDNLKQYDFYYIFFTLALAIIYLVCSVKQGCYFMSAYFAVVAFLLPLGILALEPMNKKFKYVAGVAILIINLIFNYLNIAPFNGNYEERRGWNKYFVQAKDVQTIRHIAVQRKLKNILSVSGCNVKNLNIIRDYRSVPLYSSLQANASIRENLVFGNWQECADPKNSPNQLDIVGFDKNGQAFVSDEQFYAIIQQASEQNVKRSRENRGFIQDFINNKVLNGDSYIVLFENENLVYFANNKYIDRCKGNS